MEDFEQGAHYFEALNQPLGAGWTGAGRMSLAPKSS